MPERASETALESAQSKAPKPKASGTASRPEPAAAAEGRARAGDQRRRAGQPLVAGWQPLLKEHRRRVEAGRAMGGKDKLAKRGSLGLPNARELIAQLCDEGSFREIGTLAGGFSYQGEAIAPADALVGGVARIAGRDVVVGVEDFTVMGGSIGPATNAKKVRLAQLAGQERVPFLMFLDGAGERMRNSLERHATAPNDMQVLARLSGQVPMLSVVLGCSAGHGAITGMLTDFIVMLDKALMFSAGPPLVAAAMGEKVDKETLGSARMHTEVSGVAHNLVADADAACETVRAYLGFLPDNAWQYPPDRLDSPRAAPRRLDDILTLLPQDSQRPYDMRALLSRLVDGEADWLEIQPLYGASIVTGLARLGGYSVGIVANQPANHAGAITAEAAFKAAHFLDVCNAFHLPAVFLADNPGVMSGSRAERVGTLRAAARMYAAQSRLRVPKLHVTLRKAFGFGSSLMAMNPYDGQSLSVALPGVQLGAMPADAGGQAARMSDADRRRAEQAQMAGAWKLGDTLGYDEVIDPAELRNVLINGLRLAANRRSAPAEPACCGGIAP